MRNNTQRRDWCKHRNKMFYDVVVLPDGWVFYNSKNQGIKSVRIEFFDRKSPALFIELETTTIVKEVNNEESV